MTKKETEKRVNTGVFVRTYKSGKKTIRISFTYRRKHCREFLNIEPTPNNIKKAVRLRKKILREISLNTFNYAETFPFSKNAIRFGHVSDKILVKDLMVEFLRKSKKQLNYTTHNRYERVCKAHLYPVFGDLAIEDLTPGIIWIWLEKHNWQRKTIVNNLTPLRAIVDDALIYGYIDKNPFDLINISRLRKFSSNYIVNPFNQDEIQKLLSVATGQIKNLFQVAFFTGLRTSELIGLRWEDIYWDEGIIHVRRAVVNGIEQGTKTKSSVRKVYILPSARKALEAQKEHTFSLCGRVFYNPFDHKPWKSSDQLRKRAWVPLLEKANLAYRNLYQTRHTYASMLVSAGENILWVSKQMGHETLQTTSRYYTRWIPNPFLKGGHRPICHW